MEERNQDQTLNGRDNVRSIQKRKRKPTSCLPCRQRKQGESQRHWTLSHASSSQDVRNRVERLEKLVMSMISQNASQTNSKSRNVSIALNGVRQELASFHSKESVDLDFSSSALIEEHGEDVHQEEDGVEDMHHEQRLLLVGESQWICLLNEITEVRNYLKTQEERYKHQRRKLTTAMESSPEDLGPALLFRAAKAVDRSKILAHLPSKHICSMMVDRAFDKLEPVLYIIHPPTFYDQYSQHWNDPSQTPTAWIGLLFAIMRSAILSWHRDDDVPPEIQGKCDDMAISFRTQVANCLALVDHNRTDEHLIETLIFHFYCEYASFQDANPTVWILLGTMIRLAMRMGYHQTSAQSSHLTPFQLEMRRRVWAFLTQSDILFSFQVGLPPMLGNDNRVSNLPRNFHDDDRFHPRCSEIPTALPYTEVTPISLLLIKTRLAYGFSRALRERNRSSKPSHSRILRIDKELKNIYNNIPDHYKLQSISKEDSSEISLLVSRFILASLHHKSLCVLHSRYHEVPRHENLFFYSRRTCLESALTLLQFQAIRQGNSLHNVGATTMARYQTSISSHDYLLAATIICSELVLGSCHGGSNHFQHTEPSKDQLIQALERSASIWNVSKDESLEAYKANDVLTMVLKRLRSSDGVESSTTQTTTTTTTTMPMTPRMPTTPQNDGADTFPSLLSISNIPGISEIPGIPNISGMSASLEHVAMSNLGEFSVDLGEGGGRDAANDRLEDLLLPQSMDEDSDDRNANRNSDSNADASEWNTDFGVGVPTFNRMCSTSNHHLSRGHRSEAAELEGVPPLDLDDLLSTSWFPYNGTE